MKKIYQTTDDKKLNTNNLIYNSKHSKQINPKLWILFFAVFYVVTAVPAGYLVYSIKNSAGINIFKEGGGHAFTRCIEQAFNPKNLNISN